MTLSTRPEEDEENEDYLDSDGDVEDAVTTSSPAVSDRRRRRMIAKGIDPDAVVMTNAGETAPKGRPTPAREGEEEVVSGNIFVRTWQRFTRYLRDVRSEVRKVAWPTRPEVIRLTRMVLVVLVISSIFLGLVAFMFSVLIINGISSPDWGTIAGIVTLLFIIVTAGLWLMRDRIFPNYE